MGSGSDFGKERRYENYQNGIVYRGKVTTPCDSICNLFRGPHLKFERKNSNTPNFQIPTFPSIVCFGVAGSGRTDACVRSLGQTENVCRLVSHFVFLVHEALPEGRSPLDVVEASHQ